MGKRGKPRCKEPLDHTELATSSTVQYVNFLTGLNATRTWDFTGSINDGGDCGHGRLLPEIKEI